MIGSIFLKRATTLTRWGSTSTYICIAIILSALKLLLIGSREIVALPYDAWEYIHLASVEKPWAILGPLPGYPIWLWGCQMSGVPQRIAIELLLAVCTFLFAWGIGRPLAGKAGFLVLYCLVSFSPTTYFLFDATLSDGFYACLTIAAAGLIGLIVLESSTRTVGRCLLLGAILGIMEVTRRETPIVLSMLVALTVVLAGRSWHENRSAGTALRAGAMRLACIGSLTILIVFANLATHASYTEVWSASATDLPSHLTMLRNIASIRTGESPRRFVPITRRARELAYENSPTLSRFRPFVESPDNLYQKASLAALGYPGEIGAGWIWHVYGSVAGQLGIVTPAELDRAYRQVNAELETAFASNRLPHRTVIHPLIVAPSAWIGSLPASIRKVALAITEATGPMEDLRFDPDLFDKVGLRRSALLPSGAGVVKGWVQVSRPPVKMEVFDSGLPPVVEPVAERYARPDVQLGYKKIGEAVPLDTGFLVRMPAASTPILRFRISLPDGTTINSRPLVPNAVQQLRSDDDTLVASLGIDELPAKGSVVDDRTLLMKAGIGAYGNTFAWAMVLITLTLATVVNTVRAVARDRQAVDGLSVTIVLLTWMGTRFGLYSVIDAAAWAAEPRYVQSIGLIIQGLAAALLLALFRQAWGASRTANVSDAFQGRRL